MAANDYERAKALYESRRYEEALDAYLALAETTRDPAVLSFIGRMYCRGEGTSIDEQKGLRWYAEAAEVGDPRGMLYLAGFLARRGEYERAREWVEAASRKDYGPALF